MNFEVWYRLNFFNKRAITVYSITGKLKMKHKKMNETAILTRCRHTRVRLLVDLPFLNSPVNLQCSCMKQIDHIFPWSYKPRKWRNKMLWMSCLWYHQTSKLFLNNITYKWDETFGPIRSFNYWRSLNGWGGWGNYTERRTNAWYYCDTNTRMFSQNAPRPLVFVLKSFHC